MSRTPAFDREAVLDAALALFWENGFVGTSLKQLEQATGLKPGSLYNSFRSKQALFLSVIERYVTNVVEPRVDAMHDHPDPLKGIQQFFATAFEAVPSSQLNGCLLTNTATEACIEDVAIRQAVKSGVTRLEDGFYDNLVRARDNGTLDEDADLRALAVYLTSCFQGLEVMARLYRNKRQLRVLSARAMASIAYSGDTNR